MKYFVEIDEKKQLGKSAMMLLKNIAKKGNGIIIRRAEPKEIDEDVAMVKRMLQARKGGFVNTEEFLSKLKSRK